jgi:hypothetical protein
MKIQPFLNAINPLNYANVASNTSPFQKKITALATAAIIAAVSYCVPANILSPVAKMITTGVAVLSAVAYAVLSKGAKAVEKAAVEEATKISEELKNDAVKDEADIIGEKVEGAIEELKDLHAEKAIKAAAINNAEKSA